jgi:signal transduction histidine kinase
MLHSLTPQQELVAFRIIQETLQNTLKHAEATSIHIDIEHDSTYTSITIVDNGKGFDKKALDLNETGVGLKNMKNRAKLIDAVFSIDSTPLKGTTSKLKIFFAK